MWGIGAGEVYRSYAFSQVVVARYQRPGIDAFTVELFDMGSAEDAYGVFSYAREQEEVGITRSASSTTSSASGTSS